MAGLAKPLLYLAILAFIVAVGVSLTGPVMQIPAESFSRASANLALIAIAIAVVSKGEGSPPV